MRFCCAAAGTAAASATAVVAASAARRIACIDASSKGARTPAFVSRGSGRRMSTAFWTRGVYLRFRADGVLRGAHEVGLEPGAPLDRGHAQRERAVAAIQEIRAQGARDRAER